VLRASGGSPKIHLQLSYIQATHSCSEQYSTDLFRWTWGLFAPVNPPLSAVT
jgi:hypothetical protein